MILKHGRGYTLYVSPQHSTAKAASLPSILPVGNGWTLVGNS